MTQDFNSFPLLDQAVIDACKTLMKEKFAKLYGYFLDDSAIYVEQIEKAYADKSAENLIPPSHTLKSSARQMGALRLSVMAESIEHQAREMVKTNCSIEPLAVVISQLKPILENTIKDYN